MTATLQPVIVTDTREKTPLVFTRLSSVTCTLQTGDYSVRGLEQFFSVERKSISDLVACCVGDDRQRFERELHRLRGFRFKRLLVVGTRAEIERHEYRGTVTPAAVLGSVSAWEIRFDIPVVFASTPEDAALNVERWAHYCVREVLKSAEVLAEAITKP